MPVTVDIAEIGTYTKCADKTAIPHRLPPRLNESPHLYGRLKKPLDLTIGMNGFTDEGYGDKIDSICDYLQKTTQPGSSMKEVINADFVMNRRNMKVIARSAYRLEPMNIRAIRKNGVIFLCDDNRMSPDNFSSYGFKFEQYMTMNEMGYPHDKYDRVSNAECGKSVLRTTITSGNEQLKVVYAAETDAIDRYGKCVELKTTAMTHMRWLEVASLDHYLQCYFAKVPYIIFGRKRAYNIPIVYQTDKIFTNNIPNEPVHWNKDVCFQQLFNVLYKIKSKLEYDEEALVVQITSNDLLFEPEMSNNCNFPNQNFLNHFRN